MSDAAEKDQAQKDKELQELNNLLEESAREAQQTAAKIEQERASEQSAAKSGGPGTGGNEQDVERTARASQQAQREDSAQHEAAKARESQAAKSSHDQAAQAESAQADRAKQSPPATVTQAQERSSQQIREASPKTPEPAPQKAVERAPAPEAAPKDRQAAAQVVERAREPVEQQRAPSR